jgi:hypothetical protein
LEYCLRCCRSVAPPAERALQQLGVLPARDFEMLEQAGEGIAGRVPRQLARVRH